MSEHIEPLKCKVCNGNLDDSLKCPYCGVQHERVQGNERVQGEVSIQRVCPKHLIAFSDHSGGFLQCPLCKQEHDRMINQSRIQSLYNAKQQEKLRQEQEKRIAEARVKFQEWKSINYPKLKKVSAGAVLCLIIGIVSLSALAYHYIKTNTDWVLKTTGTCSGDTGMNMGNMVYHSTWVNTQYSFSQAIGFVSSTTIGWITVAMILVSTFVLGGVIIEVMDIQGHEDIGCSQIAIT